MQTTEEILTTLKDYKADKSEMYGIETLGLFGSVARGEQHENSDIDVCVRLKSLLISICPKFRKSWRCSSVAKWI